MPRMLFFRVLRFVSLFILGWLVIVINALIIENYGRFELLRLIEEYENVLIKFHGIKNVHVYVIVTQFFFNSQSVLYIIFEFTYK